MDPHIARSKRPQRGVGLDLLGLGEHPERPLPYVALQPGTRIDELKRVRRDGGIHRDRSTIFSQWSHRPRTAPRRGGPPAVEDRTSLMRASALLGARIESGTAG